MKKPKNPQAAAQPKPKKAKAAKPDKAAKAEAAAAKDHNTATDKQMQELFLHHSPKYAALIDRKNKVARDLQAFGKTIKSDGFSMAQFKLAHKLSTPEGEADHLEQLRSELDAARWIGAAVGTQFNLPMDTVDRTPAVDKAREAGKRASMKGEGNVPPHAPDTPQARAWIAGWQEHQTTLAKGFKKKAEDEPKSPPVAPVSGTAMTRSEFNKQAGNA